MAIYPFDRRRRRVIVVVESKRAMTTEEFVYDTVETTRVRELALGVVREPSEPFFSHEALVLRVAKLLRDHVEPRNLGHVAIAPIDVVLDPQRALVVQPDVLLVCTERLSIIRDQVWGAPDLVVEILSRDSENHDRGEKLGWYRQYGVRECWLVDPCRAQVTVVDFTGSFPAERVARDADSIGSAVLPDLNRSAFSIFS
jgi:Uma2 family endonuclease